MTPFTVSLEHLTTKSLARSNADVRGEGIILRLMGFRLSSSLNPEHNICIDLPCAKGDFHVATVCCI